MKGRPPQSPPFPYTTLFRSAHYRFTLKPAGLAGLADSLRPYEFVVQVAPRQFEVKVEGHSERSEEHTSELQSLRHLVCRLLLEKKNEKKKNRNVMTQEINNS